MLLVAIGLLRLRNAMSRQESNTVCSHRAFAVAERDEQAEQHYRLPSLDYCLALHKACQR